MNRKVLLARNQFFLPPKATIEPPKIEHPNSIVLDKMTTEQRESKSLKTFLKNQRRSARRRGATVKRSDSSETGSVGTLPVDVPEQHGAASSLLLLPADLLTESILPFLEPRDLAALSSCSKQSQKVAEDGQLWMKMYQERFPQSRLVPLANSEWKRAYQLSETKLVDRLRCFSTKKTF
jgi:hypothetical protein